MAHSSNPSPWKAEARGLQIRGQPGLQNQTLCLKKKKMTTWSQSAVFSFWTHSHQLLILLSKLHNHNPELYLKCFALQFPLVYFIRTNWTLGAGCFHMLWRMGEHRAADRAEHTHSLVTQALVYPAGIFLAEPSSVSLLSIWRCFLYESTGNPVGCQNLGMTDSYKPVVRVAVLSSLTPGLLMVEIPLPSALDL